MSSAECDHASLLVTVVVSGRAAGYKMTKYLLTNRMLICTGIDIFNGYRMLGTVLKIVLSNYVCETGYLCEQAHNIWMIWRNIIHSECIILDICTFLAAPCNLTFYG